MLSLLLQIHMQCMHVTSLTYINNLVESACRGGIMDSGCDIYCTQPANHTAKAQSQIVRWRSLSVKRKIQQLLTFCESVDGGLAIYLWFWKRYAYFYATKKVGSSNVEQTIPEINQYQSTPMNYPQSKNCSFNKK